MGYITVYSTCLGRCTRRQPLEYVSLVVVVRINRRFTMLLSGIIIVLAILLTSSTTIAGASLAASHDNRISSDHLNNSNHPAFETKALRNGQQLQQQDRPKQQESKKSSSEIPSWDELDNRTVPTWYDESKFGVFIHWGVFSVPSFVGEWFWEQWEIEKKQNYIDFIQRTEKPGFSYVEYASRFTADLYNASDWANVFSQSGAQYVVLTSKHHEGYCNWNSTDIPTTWNWNVMDVGPRRDILGELSVAVKQSISPYTNLPLKFGVYHSLYEWFNPMYLSDQKSNYTKQDFVNNKILPELYDLVNKYQPELIWSDGEWEADSTYWKAREFLNWYSTESTVASTAVWNDRWGSEVRCRHGSFVTCDDKYNPNQLQQRKFENAFTIDLTSWGYSRASHYTDYISIKELIHTLIQVVAFNGNVLINIGPAADGTIHPIFVDRLLGIGDWLKVNGEAIYKTRPWEICPNETASNVYYTTKDSILYAHFLKWPRGNVLQLQCPMAIPNQTTIRFLGVTMLHDDGEDDNDISKGLHWKQSDYGTGMDINLPFLTPDRIPCQHAWVLAISHVNNLSNHPTLTDIVQQA